MILRIPQGFERFRVRDVDAVAHERVATNIREVLGTESLYSYAARHPDRRELVGRLPAYAAPLPSGGPRVVVRRSHHGGMLARVTRDVFLSPTRAPYELLVSLLLGRAGVPTPPVLAYALYPVAPLLRRADVATGELVGDDLGHVLEQGAAGATPDAWLPPVSALLRRLTAAGAWHPDLNVKNILLAPDEAGATVAWVLDVDRIRFHSPEDPTVRAANFNRLARSLRKWGARAASAVDERVVRHLRDLAFAT